MPLSQLPINDPLDVDLPCPGNEAAVGCGYNLRGLPGDPVRCPECGAQYARAGVRMAVLEHQMRGFAEPPAGTASLVWATLMCGSMSLTFISLIPGLTWSLFHLLTVASLAALTFAVLRFRRRMRVRSGWWIALLAYLFAFVAFPIGLVFGGASGIVAILMGFSEGNEEGAAILGLFFLALMGLVLASLAAYSFSTKRMQRMMEAETMETMARLGIAPDETPPEPQSHAEPQP